MLDCFYTWRQEVGFLQFDGISLAQVLPANSLSKSPAEASVSGAEHEHMNI
jgi:hypothetical protein